MPVPFAAIAAVGVVGLVGAVTVAAIVSNADSAESAAVERVIDGDTLDVLIGGDTHRVRLLNIDAPEDSKSTGVSECMGAEATAALMRLLPVGTEVALEYDEERRDKYDRLLAGVFIEETLINSEMARAGLAGPMLVGGNDRFFGEVSSAADEARANEIGIYGQELPCALGSTVAGYEKQVTDAAAAALPADSAALANTLTSTAALVAAAEMAKAAVDAVSWIDVDVRAPYHRAISAARVKASALESSVQTALDSAKAAEEAARIAAERAEAERIAAEQAEAQRQAAAQAEAERRAAAETRQSSSSGGSTSTGGSGPTGGSTGYDGYTGCRAYGGGYTPNAIDEQGRPYTKIDCTTKQPISG
ncbi:thermonuclease family protein [Microbacterium sp. NPDC055455]